MTSVDIRSVPMPILVGQLDECQLDGTACVWCAVPITAHDRHEVGFTGRPVHHLFGCTRCVVILRRRLPIWPEPGSA